MGVRSFGAVRVERIDPDLADWNNRIVTVLQIETPEAVENAEAIARVPGVDALHVGALDLALRLGKNANDYTAIAMVEPQIERVAEACARAGKAAAVIALSESSVQESHRKG